MLDRASTLIPRKDYTMACTCSGTGGEIMEDGRRHTCVVCHPPRSTPQGLAEAQRQAANMTAVRAKKGRK